MSRILATHAHLLRTTLVLGAALLLPASLSQAATITHTLDANDTKDKAGTPVVTVEDLATSPTASLSGSSYATISVSGSFDSSVVSPGSSYRFTATSFKDSDFNSSTNAVTNRDNKNGISARSGRGWGDEGTFNDIHAVGEGLVLTFDLSGLPSGTFLLLTEAVVHHWRVSPEAQVIVEGVGHDSVEITGGTQTLDNLNFKIEDGDELIFRGADTDDKFHGFHAKSFTLQAVIPEPASVALVGVGGLMLLARRRRN